MTVEFRVLRSKVFGLCRQAKYEDALAFCQAQIGNAKNEKERVSISLLIPYVLEREGRHSASRDELESIIKANKAHRGARYYLLHTLIKLGEFDQVMAIADQLIEVDAKFAFQSFTSAAYFHKAYAAWKLGDFKQARAALDKSDEVEPIWINGSLISRDELAASISRND